MTHVVLIHLFNMATYSLKSERLAQLLTLCSLHKAVSGHVKAGMQEQEVRGQRDIPGCHFTCALPVTPPDAYPETAKPFLRHRQKALPTLLPFV